MEPIEAASSYQIFILDQMPDTQSGEKVVTPPPLAVKYDSEVQKRFNTYNPHHEQSGFFRRKHKKQLGNDQATKYISAHATCPYGARTTPTDEPEATNSARRVPCARFLYFVP